MHPGPRTSGIAKRHYEEKLKHDPKRFLRKVRAELKHCNIGLAGKVERLLYLAFLKIAAPPARVDPWLDDAEQKELVKTAHRRHMKMLRRVANLRGVLVRDENLGRNRDMIGVRRLMHSATLTKDELKSLVKTMREENTDYNVGLPKSAFDELDAFCVAAVHDKRKKPRRSHASKLGRRLCTAARTASQAMSASAAA